MLSSFNFITENCAATWCTNYNLDDIHTPVNAEVLKNLLEEAGYSNEKISYLYKGFKHGFSLKYRGQRKVQRFAPNLKIRVGSKEELWEKVMKEVKEKRFAGPYEGKPPYRYFIQSPIGLVPKDKGHKTRLIFHLSYPRQGKTSVNSGIRKDDCTVVYPDFAEAIQMCSKSGICCRISKSDMSMAFRHVPLKKRDWPLLIMMAKHPESGVVYYFVEKCLSFGCSISCKIFQDISDAIAAMVKYRTQQDLINYLDDFFFAAAIKVWCDWQMQQFLDVCSEIQFPVSLEKPFWGTTILVFLGLLINTEKQVICIPVDKVLKTLEKIQHLLSKKNRKATVKQIQELCGMLNFLCKCVVPGRAFLMRLYALVSSKLKPHHHIAMTSETRADLKIWETFLNYPGIFCRPFIDHQPIVATDIDMYSDATRNFSLGFGAICGSDWMWSNWDRQFMEKAQPSIAYLELWALTAGVLRWIHRFENRRIFLFCDNKTARDIVNSASSKCKNNMVLVRLITLKSMLHNVRVYVKYVPSKENKISDALSRNDWIKFKQNGPHMNEISTEIPDEIWPISKIWLW